MKIPLKYNFRSLLLRRGSTVMTAGGIGLTVATIVVIAAMVGGLDSIFLETGDPGNLVVFRKGSQNEVNSFFNKEIFESIRFLPGIAKGKDGVPIAAGEIIVAINYDKLSGGASNVIVRGVLDTSLLLRPDFRIIEGRFFKKGLREMIVGSSLSRRFKDMRNGDVLTISGQTWDVVGIFETEGTAYDSEIWADYDQIAQVWQRPIYSSVLLQAESIEKAEALAIRISEDRRIQMDAVNQQEYFSSQTISSAGLKALGAFIALIIGIGSCFAIMNMMYGAVMSRSQEIATLRLLGFKRRSILASFLVEAIVLAFFGGILGCLLGSFFHGYTAGTTNFVSFSEIVFQFRITTEVLAMGLIFALVTGVLGGLLPAIRAARVDLISIMRE